MMKTWPRRSSTASSSAAESSHSTGPRCGPNISDLTTRPLLRHYINRPEFPELKRQNFRNPQEPPFPSHGGGADVILHEVIVNLEAPVAEIPDQRVVLVEEVRERLPHRALGQALWLQLKGAAFQVFPDRQGLLLMPERLARDRPARAGAV